jgi:hypothetical protein
MLLTCTLCRHTVQEGQCDTCLFCIGHLFLIHTPRWVGPCHYPEQQSQLSPHLVVQYNGPGTVKVLPDQHFAHGSIQVAHFNPVCSCICPVHFPANGIYCEPICGLQPCRKSEEHSDSCFKTDGIFPSSVARQVVSGLGGRLTCGDDVLMLWAIQIGTADPMQRAVRPVYFSWRGKAWLNPVPPLP